MNVSRDHSPLLNAEGIAPALDPPYIAGVLDLACQSSSITVVTGPNAEETTLWLETLAAFHPLAAGRLRVLEYDSDNAGGESDLRRQAGYVDADAPLLSTFDVLMNVMLPRRYHFGESNGDALRVANGLLDRLDYRGPRNALPARLSALEKMQVLLARALALDPALIFLDEPFSIETANDWRELAAHIGALARDDNRAVLVATRNLAFAAAYADQVVFVQDGEIQRFETWEHFTAATQAAVFLDKLPFILEVRE